MDENKTVCVYLSASRPDDIWKRLPAIPGSGGTHWPHLLGHNQEEEMCCEQQQSAWVLCFNGFKKSVLAYANCSLQGDHYANAYSKQVGN